jgi:seryl-tRNA synthetase
VKQKGGIMLDIKEIRENHEEIIKRLNTRGDDYSYVSDIVKYDKQKRDIIQDVENFKSFRNETSKKIGALKRDGQDASVLMKEVTDANNKISVLDNALNEIEKKINKLLFVLPNVPRETIPIGVNEENNRLVRTHLTPKTLGFEAKAHWDIGTELGIFDFERATKITGSRFTVYKGLGAKLERSLISFMLDLHTLNHGYEEMLPPFMVNANSMFGTGQLPKFEEDAFKVEPFNYYLAPTAEVPVTNYYANEILSINDLPKYYAAYTPCFRAEAGSAGRDTRGIIRQHQFNKVELVKFVLPENSEDELEKLTINAEKVLQLLELPYRVVELCTGDLGFSSAHTYDLEVWLPSSESYREISSCSNFGDFQARRANIRFKRETKGKTEYVHTINGSGLAVGRTVAAILENYQLEDGSVQIPEVLKPYFNGLEKIEKN